MVKVNEIMKRYVVTAGPELSLADVAKIMTNNRIGSIVIVKKGKPIGIVTDSDIVTAVAQEKDPKKIKIKDMAKRDFVTASPNENILRVTRRMVKTGVKRVPVLRGGRLEGIVSDKEILSTAPEMISVLSEKLKARIASVSPVEEFVSGICEGCGGYSDELKNIGGKWLCENCRDE